MDKRDAAIGGAGVALRALVVSLVGNAAYAFASGGSVSPAWVLYTAAGLFVATVAVFLYVSKERPPLLRTAREVEDDL